MLKRIKLLYLSTKAWISFILSRKGTLKTKASTLPTELYRTAAKTPVSVLRECLINNNLNALIISGEPSQAYLAEAWAQLFGEYFDLIKSGRSKYIQTLQKNVIIREMDTRTIENAALLTGEAVKAYQDILIELGIGGHDKEFPDFALMLERHRNKLAFTKLKLTQEMEELESLTKEENQPKIEENYFDRMIVRLYEKFGYFDEKVITVAQMCAMMSIYISDSKVKDNAGSKHDKRTV